MAHQSSSESDDQIPSQPLDLNSPHPSKDIIIKMKQQEEEDPFSLSNLSCDDIHRDKDVTENPCASEALVCKEEKMALQATMDEVAGESSSVGEDSGRERLKQHRVEVAGRVWIPEIWGQEELLKDWIDCTAFDAPLVPSRISTAREALVEDCTRVNAAGLRIENRDKKVSSNSD